MSSANSVKVSDPISCINIDFLYVIVPDFCWGSILQSDTLLSVTLTKKLVTDTVQIFKGWFATNMQCLPLDSNFRYFYCLISINTIQVNNEFMAPVRDTSFVLRLCTKFEVLTSSVFPFRRYCAFIMLGH